LTILVGRKPFVTESDFILSLCELIVGAKDGLQPVEKSIIDLCVLLIYQDYLADPIPKNVPILGKFNLKIKKFTINEFGIIGFEDYYI